MMLNRILRMILVSATIALSSAPVVALQQSASPPKFDIPWANSAGVPYIRSIPVPSQIGIQNCAASLTDGWPPLTFTPAGAGGCPPFGADFNGILKQISQWSQWQAAGGPIFYDSAFATSGANGYPNGAIVQSTIVPGDFWLSTADNNTSNPDVSGANWVPLPGMAQTGTVGWSLIATIPFGWVPSQPGETIGSAASGASVANSTTQFLYAWFWNNFSNTQCPVTGGRGANAAADFAANKPIQVFNMTGSMQISNDFLSGILTGVPDISGTANANGSIIGEVLHTLTVGQLPQHTHNYSGTTGSENQNHTHNITSQGLFGGTTSAGFATPGGTQGLVNFVAFGPTSGIEQQPHNHNFSGTTDGGTGGSAAANNTPRAVVGTWMFKL